MTAENKQTQANDDLLKALLSVEDKPERTVRMKRFGDFRIKALGEKELQRLKDQATYGDKLDEDKFNALMIVESCIVPDWNHPELKAKYGGEPDASQIVRKRLLPGELLRLSEKIVELSGFTSDEDEIPNS